MTTPTVRGASQSDLVITAVMEMITSGSLSAGSRLPIEKILAERFGVSRGSLREGVRALVLLGVLETRQGDGTYVTSLQASQLLSPVGMFAELQSPGDAVHLLEVRRVLEMESAARAAARATSEDVAELDLILDGIDDLVRSHGTDVDLEAFIDADTDFHRAVAQASGNPVLAGLVDNLVSRTFRSRLWRAIERRGSEGETQAEHRAILEAIRGKDPERARLMMAIHVIGVEQFARTHSDESQYAPPG